MSNKKSMPAAGKSAAGKNNSGKSSSQKAKEKQRSLEEKNAKRIAQQRQKKQEEREKKSREIQKKRAKQSESQRKTEAKAQNKAKRNEKTKNLKKRLKKIWKKIKYYTSKDFLSSFNYVRILIFVGVPLAALVFCIIMIAQSVFVNVPLSIRNESFNGRIESEYIAEKSVFNLQQQQVFLESLKAKGSHKFSFYINSVINVGDENSTDNLCFGNPEKNDCILIATIYDKSGNVLYRSLGIEPGRELNDAKFFESLSYGMHDVKVAVNAFDKQTNKKIGTRYAKIKLAVGVDYEDKK